jgi:DNA-binding NarL/FixJ family response regulator
VAAVELRERGHRLGVLLLSQAVETHFAAQLLERHSESFGYLLKDRVIDVATLMSALHTIQGGGTVLDPEIVRHLMAREAAADPLAALTERERDVLALMAEGRSNSAIADRLTVSLKTVESHIANIFSKLGLHGAQDDHRRVLAVLAALRGGADGAVSPTA